MIFDGAGVMFARIINSSYTPKEIQALRKAAKPLEPAPWEDDNRDEQLSLEEDWEWQDDYDDGA